MSAFDETSDPFHSFRTVYEHLSETKVMRKFVSIFRDNNIDPGGGVIDVSNFKNFHVVTCDIASE